MKVPDPWRSQPLQEHQEITGTTAGGAVSKLGARARSNKTNWRALSFVLLAGVTGGGDTIISHKFTTPNTDIAVGQALPLLGFLLLSSFFALTETQVGGKVMDGACVRSTKPRSFLAAQVDETCCTPLCSPLLCSFL